MQVLQALKQQARTLPRQFQRALHQTPPVQGRKIPYPTYTNPDEVFKVVKQPFGSTLKPVIWEKTLGEGYKELMRHSETHSTQLTVAGVILPQHEIEGWFNLKCPPHTQTNPTIHAKRNERRIAWEADSMPSIVNVKTKQTLINEVNESQFFADLEASKDTSTEDVKLGTTLLHLLPEYPEFITYLAQATRDPKVRYSWSWITQFGTLDMKKLDNLTREEAQKACQNYGEAVKSIITQHLRNNEQEPNLQLIIDILSTVSPKLHFIFSFHHYSFSKEALDSTIIPRT